jgi:phosphoribosyl-AMP cyclohydrolase
MAARQDNENGLEFTPKFDRNGLITAVAQDAKTGQVLMVGFMNQQALDLTIQTGYATYFSRSRQKLWKKGEQSGHFQKVQQILVDCDQDCLLLKVTVDAGQCHKGYQSCFYRALLASGRSPLGEAEGSHGEEKTKGKLKLIAEKVYDPQKNSKL